MIYSLPWLCSGPPTPQRAPNSNVQFESFHGQELILTFTYRSARKIWRERARCDKSSTPTAVFARDASFFLCCQAWISSTRIKEQLSFLHPLLFSFMLVSKSEVWATLQTWTSANAGANVNTRQVAVTWCVSALQIGLIVFFTVRIKFESACYVLSQRVGCRMRQHCWMKFGRALVINLMVVCLEHRGCARPVRSVMLACGHQYAHVVGGLWCRDFLRLPSEWWNMYGFHKHGSSHFFAKNEACGFFFF